MNEKHDSAADVRLERIVSLRPCPFCGGESAMNFWLGDVQEIYCKKCLAAMKFRCERDWIDESAMQWNRRAADKYERANPLGGPAKIFEAVASRVRAGEPLDDVMLDYGLRWTDKAG